MTASRSSACRRSAVGFLLASSMPALVAAQTVFEPPQTLLVAVDSPLSPVAGDFDGDTHVDFVYLDTSGLFDQEFRTLLGAGDGTFTEQSGGVTVSTLGATELTDVVDFDNDGDLDILNRRITNSGSVYVTLGDGDGTFQGELATVVGAGVVRAAVTDLDGNAFPDVVAAADGIEPGTPATVGVATGDGDGTFTLVTSLASPFGIDDVAAGEINGDAFIDIVGTYDDGTVRVWLGAAGLTFSPGTSTTMPGNRIDLVDLDDDGALDLVGSGGFGIVAVRMGNGDGTFGPQENQSTSAGTRQVAFDDFDGDGNLDIGVLTLDLVFPSFFTDFEVLRGAGDGSFESDVIVTAGKGLSGPAVGDVDEDGFPDAFFTRSDPSGDGLALIVNHTYGPGSPYLDLGCALPGDTGYPIFLADGTLVAGEPFDWTLTAARPSSLAFLVFGLSLADVPFKGGQLKPFPDVVFPGIFTSGLGTIPIPGTWPPSVGGFDIYLQWWITDPTAVFGFQSSTGVRASVP